MTIGVNCSYVSVCLSMTEEELAIVTVILCVLVLVYHSEVL